MRYDRLDPLNIDTERLQDATIAVVGLGATGSHMAENLARHGADLILVDRDVLEHSNLTTSALYMEEHVEQRLPKAVAARRIESFNADSLVEAHVADINSTNIQRLLGDADLILDGTDNLETRFLLNEYSLKTGTPWIHVSALGYSGEVMPVIPNKTACFHCIFADKDGTALETCETAGILKETASTAANLATATAVAYLNGDNVSGLTRFDLKKGSMRTLAVSQREDCSVCNGERYPYLEENAGSVTTALCGEHKYQINPVREDEIDLKSQAAQLRERGGVSVNTHLLRFASDDATFTLFKSGRAIINAENEEQAKTIYSRFIGN